MSKIARYAGNLPAFGSNAQGLERTVFGSTVQADDLTSQVTDAFRRGWGVVGPSENPSLEDFNGAFYTLSQLIAYQHQMGIPEWDAKQEYYLGSVCTYKGEMYESLSNSNTGSEPPSAQWTLVITAKNGISKLGLGEAAKRDVGTGTNQIPDMSSFRMTKAASGYSQFPNGVIIQWGSFQPPANTSINTTTVIFPIQFPISLAAVSAIVSTTDPSSRFVGINYPNSDKAKALFTSYFAAGTANAVFWIAIGY